MHSAVKNEASGLAGPGFRHEIQGLRAIAVLVVAVYHIWPSMLPGGYVGVDVFFVISGYLITGILFRQISANGRVNLGEFYSRRIRRLLPAAAVVLVAVAVLMPLLPQTRWDDTVSGIVASTFYVQNWWLASQAIDYLAAESAPSAVMHFWSLSVEEQYYIAWPLLLMMLCWLPARRAGGREKSFAALVSVIILLSLAYSIWLTYRNPELAYFSTLTRAWELGAGGLLAATVRWRSLSQRARDLLGWVGLGMIAAAVFTFDQSTAFPGYTALLPVVGTMLVLVARDSSRRFSAYGVLRLRPFQYFGDISYSLYLWHWPVIITYAALVGRSPGLTDGLTILVISAALAHQSKALVEDRFREGAAGPSGTRNAAGLAAACITLSLVAAWAGPRPWRGLEPVGPGIPTTASSRVPNPGATVLTDGAMAGSGNIRPAPGQARRDFPAPYRERCIASGDAAEVSVCEYGDPDGAIRVVLAGDTYAAQWQPALEAVARENDWRLSVVVKSGCVLGTATQLDSTGRPSASCEVWRRGVVDLIRRWQPELLFVAQSPAARVQSANENERVDLLAQSLFDFARETDGAVGSLVFVRSTPTMGGECRETSELDGCGRPRASALPARDPVVLAHARLPGVHLIDMSDGICHPERCDAVVGNVVVYRGQTHLTSTYASTLAPFLGRAIAGMRGLEAIKVPESTGAAPLPDIVQRALAAKRDNPDLYRDGCHADQVSPEPTFCVYGNPESGTRVVLAGDSHAAQWLPALQRLAEKNDWALYSFTKSTCAFSEATVQVGGREYRSCSEWNKLLMRKLLELQPAAVVTSQSRGHRAHGADDVEDGQRRLARGLLDRWATLSAMGIGVVVVADTPWMRKDIPDCLSSNRADKHSCGTTLELATRNPDSTLRAMAQNPDVTFLDLNQRICPEGNCPAMKGDIVMWRDRHHLTATFARTFAPFFEPAVNQAIEDGAVE